MGLKNKFLFLALGFFVVIVFLVSALFYWSAKATISSLTENGSSAVETVKHTELQKTVKLQAEVIAQFLDRYYDDVAFLRDYYQQIETLTAQPDATKIKDLYPGKEKGGLPGFGYVHEKYGAYADFSQLSGGSPWLPKWAVEQVQADPVFLDKANSDLRSAMTIGQLFPLIGERHKTTLDLVWIVLTSGATNAYPAYDYPAIIADNPMVVDLNENEEDYVRLLNPENNPNREIKWLVPYYDEFRQSWMTSVVAPLYRGDEFVGTVGMDVLLHTLTERVINFPVGESGYAFLLDHANGLIAMPKAGIEELIMPSDYRQALLEQQKPAKEQKWTPALTDLLEQRNFSDSVDAALTTTIAEIRKEKGGVREISLDERDLVLSVSHVSGADWCLVAVVPRNELMAFSQGVETAINRFFAAAAKRSILVFLLGALLIFAAGMVIYSSVVNPLLQMAQQFREGDPGNLIIDGDLAGRRDEIGVLCQAFKGLSNELKKAQANQKKANEDLADKVDKLRRVNAAMVGREKKMQELKKRIDELNNSKT